MSEAQAAPTAHEERLEALGKDQASAARMAEVRAKGAAKIKAACALYDSMGSAEASAQTIRAQVQAQALAAMPDIMANMIRLAKGEKRKGEKLAPSAPVQIEASRLVAGAAQVQLEVAPGAAGGVPLAEMGLEDLQGTLAGMVDNIQRLRALEGEARTVEDAPSTTQDIDTQRNELPS